MALNTANLVTTANGQAELGKIHGVNARLFADHREISVELLFPYIAISIKTPSEIEALQSVTEANVKQEASWTNVDICQVQSYSIEGELKRDFTIGGLFDIKRDIATARTVVLFAKSRIVDSRSSGRKVRDGNRDAADIVQVDYGYTAKIVPYAYTRILDKNGVYHEDTGEPISASRYGRSRHRFYFNYIIDSALANNITVADSRYPYSDGYLSKTAFELGLKRYEQALEEFVKVSNSRNLYYKNVNEVVTGKAAAGHKFYLEQDPYSMYSNFVEPNMKNNESYGFSSYANGNHFTYPETYNYGYWDKTFTAKNFDQYAKDENGYAINDSISERGIKLFNVDCRKIKYKKLSGDVETKYMPVRVDCLYMIRTGMPLMNKLPFHSLYNIARVVVQIYDEENDTLMDNGFELYSGYPQDYSDRDRLFIPQMLSVGEIYIEEEENYGGVKKNIKVSMMAQCVRLQTEVYDSSGSVPRYNVKLSHSLNIYRASWGWPRGDSVGAVIDSIEKMPFVYTRQWDRYQDASSEEFWFYADLIDGEFVPVNLENTNGNICYMLQPNFVGGYGFAVLVQNGYENALLPKDFSYSDFNNLPIVSGNDAYNKPYCGLYVMNDSAIRLYTDDRCDVIVDKNKTVQNIDMSNCNFMNVGHLQSLKNETYRLLGDFKLHNARVLIGELITNDTYREWSPSRRLSMEVYTSNKSYRISFNYSILFGSYYNRYGTPLFEIEAIEILEAEKMTYETIGGSAYGHRKSVSFRMIINRHYSDGTNFYNEKIERRFTGNETNSSPYIDWAAPMSGPDSADSSTPPIISECENSPMRWVAIKDIGGNINVTKETPCP